MKKNGKIFSRFFLIIFSSPRTLLCKYDLRKKKKLLLVLYFSLSLFSSLSIVDREYYCLVVVVFFFFICSIHYIEKRSQMSATANSKPLVVITGASSGIGEAAAKSFSAAGHPLLLIARRLDRLEALNLPNTICAQVDVTDRPKLISAINDAVAKYGPVDCLINNAGVMLLGKVQTQDPEEWQRMFDVNLMGVLNGTHAVLPSMSKLNLVFFCIYTSFYFRDL